MPVLARTDPAAEADTGAAMAIPLTPEPEPLVDAGADDGVVETIQPGRALALADFAPPRLGAGERLIRFAYRLGVPGHALSFAKSEKLRLLGTVTDPLAGDKVAGTALRAGYFLLHGVKLAIVQAELGGVARMTPPMERYVHGFDWLADLSAAATREMAAPIAERVLAAWLNANPAPPPRPAKVGAWSVDLTGQRLLAWLVDAPLLLSGDAMLRTRALAAIEAQARWLDRHVTRAEDPLAQLAGWCAIVAAGLLLPEGKPRRLFGEAGLLRTMGELVGDDGGALSRGPLAQMAAIALLVRLRACYEALGRDAPSALAGLLDLLVPPLLTLTHGDGGLGSWQGGWAVGADDVARLVAASQVRTRPLRDVRQWGYQRVVAGKSVLQFDAAPPPLARHARSGCASTLAFELSCGPQRLIVNCGGAAAAGGLIPARLEQGLRATAAHSTLVVGDANSTAVLIGGRLGKGVDEVDIERRTIGGERGVKNGQWGATRIEASHDGYAARHGLIHRRILILRDDGTELRGEDLLVPSRGKGSRGKIGFAIRFHLGSGIEAFLSEDKQGATLALPDGSTWQMRCGAGELTVEDSLWADRHGRPEAIQQLVLQGLTSRGGGSFAWLLKRMG